MMIYDYIFYKIYRVTRLLDRSVKKEQWGTIIGPVAIISLLETFLLGSLVKYLFELYNIDLTSRLLGLAPTIFLVTLNSIYFFKGGRWKKIIARYENESKSFAIIIGAILFVGIVLYLIMVYSWAHKEREKKIRLEYGEKGAKTIEEHAEEFFKNREINKFAWDHRTYFFGSNKFLMGKTFNWEKSKELSQIIGDRPVTKELIQMSRSYPGGWVYEINEAYGKDGNVTEEAVLGIWEIGKKGEINKFYPNPSYNKK